MRVGFVSDRCMALSARVLWRNAVCPLLRSSEVLIPYCGDDVPLAGTSMRAAH